MKVPSWIVLGMAVDAFLTYPLQVRVQEATIQGTTHGKVRAFYNIPFAQPPVGPLRFAAPRPNILRGTIDATKPGPVCLQVRKEVGTSEDCLQLNIYTPKNRFSTPLPVVVWVYGGAFDSGSGIEPLYNATSIVERSNVVFVTFNYRVGIFGFLGGHGGEGCIEGAGVLR
jgi:para-nitrobenzyl esterase